MIVKKKKYIIELPENTHWIQWIMEGTKDHHPYMDYKQVEDLIPYTEPDLEQVRKDYDAFYEHGYEQGLADAWEAARKVVSLSSVDRRKVFGTEYMYSILEHNTASEAIEKIRQYEQEKEEKITKGDVVRMKSAPGLEILVTFADETYFSGIALTEVDDYCKIGDQYTDIVIHKVEKTGRHYEIAEVLRKMKES